MIDPEFRYRRLYYWGTFSNSLSFPLMMGNLVTLFLLQIGTNKSMMGLISAFPWFAMLFSGMGKGLIQQYGVIQTVSWIWIIRALLLVPQIMAPIMILLGAGTDLVVAIFLITQLFFQICRGIGIAGNIPIFDKLTIEKQRTSFFINLQVVTNTGNLIAIAASSILLRNEQLWMYSIFYAVGIVLGIVTGMIYGLQEEIPQSTQVVNNLTDQPNKIQRNSLLLTLINFFSYKDSRLFALSALLSFGLSSIVSVFLIVYFKEAYSIGDSSAMTYSLGGPIAIIIFGLAARPLLNRMGPKPVSVLTTIALSFGVTAMLIDMRTSLWQPYWIFLLNILIVISTVILQDSLQAYFLNHLNDRKDLNKSLLITIIRGIGGIGVILGGFALDTLHSLPILSNASDFNIFRIFWAAVLVLLAINLLLLLSLKRGSAMTLSQSIGVFLSPRAWQGVWLLERSQGQVTTEQHQELVSAIRKGPASPILSQELPQLIRAPNLLLRLEALEVLNNPEVELTQEAKQLLIEHVSLSPYTTGANAVNILGRRGIYEAIPVLQQALNSTDYNLKAQAILALGRLGHRDSLKDVRDILLNEYQNQRICIYSINSIKLLGCPEVDIPLLLDCFENWQESRRMQEEITLAFSTLLGIEKIFYHDYCSFIEDMASTWNHVLTGLAQQRKWSAAQKQELQLNEGMFNDVEQRKRVSGLLSQLEKQDAQQDSQLNDKTKLSNKVNKARKKDGDRQNSKRPHLRSTESIASAISQADLWLHWLHHKQLRYHFWQTPSSIFLDLVLLSSRK